MKRDLDQLLPWIVIPIGALAACLFLVVAQWVAGDGSRRDRAGQAESQERISPSNIPPVAKHNPKVATGYPTPRPLPRMESGALESAKASDLPPNRQGTNSRRSLASLHAVPVLNSADLPGRQVSTGWLPTNPDGAIGMRPVPLLDFGQNTAPIIATPAPRYGANLLGRIRDAVLPHDGASSDSDEPAPLELVNSLFEPPAIERPDPTSTLQAVAGSAGSNQFVPLPSIRQVLDQLQELPPVESCAIDSAADSLGPSNVLVPLPPVDGDNPGAQEPLIIADSESTTATEEPAPANIFMPLPPVDCESEVAAPDVAVAEPFLLPPPEPRKSAAIGMVGNLFEPAKPIEEIESPAPEDGAALGDEPLPAEPADLGGVFLPLPPVDEQPAVASEDADEAEEETFDPKKYERTWDLELMAQEADKHTRRAFELAGRRAYFSSRMEFIRALRIVAQALDTLRETDRHSQALAAGLRALDEAEDFLPTEGHLEAELDLAIIAGPHRTPVLREADLEQMTPLAAIRKYHTYAQEQMAIAVGKETAGSMALYGLGKLYVAMADQRRSGSVVSSLPKAMVLLQAALVASPDNNMASNELGVLLAKNGRPGEAAAAFEHSVSTHPTAEAYRNLALTYERLGQMDKAYQAARQTLALRDKAPGATTTSLGMVRWVPPAELARAGGNLHTASTSGRSDRTR